MWSSVQEFKIHTCSVHDLHVLQPLYHKKWVELTRYHVRTYQITPFTHPESHMVLCKDVHLSPTHEDVEAHAEWPSQHESESVWTVKWERCV